MQLKILVAGLFAYLLGIGTVAHLVFPAVDALIYQCDIKRVQETNP